MGSVGVGTKVGADGLAGDGMAVGLAEARRAKDSVGITLDAEDTGKQADNKKASRNKDAGNPNRDMLNPL